MTDDRLRGLVSWDTELAVGTVVVVLTSDKQRPGIVVQIGDEDDHSGAVLVHMGIDPGYPCWWNAEVVVPAALLAPPTAEPAGAEE